MKLVWLPGALNDLERLEAFLAQHIEAEAGSVAEIIKDAARSLGEFPERCRRIPGRPDFRELFVEAYSQIYVVQFRIADQSVVVVRVWHSREAR